MAEFNDASPDQQPPKKKYGLLPPLRTIISGGVVFVGDIPGYSMDEWGASRQSVLDELDAEADAEEGGQPPNEAAMPQLSLCAVCKHLTPDKPGPLARAAFPNGIPAHLFRNDPPHFEAAEGDQGIRFELKEGLDAEGRRTALKIVDMARRQLALERTGKSDETGQPTTGRSDSPLEQPRAPSNDQCIEDEFGQRIEGDAMEQPDGAEAPEPAPTTKGG